MAGGDAVAIGHSDGDGRGVELAVQMRACRFEVVASGASVGDGIVGKRGWGTACHMVHIMEISMVMTRVCRPCLSGASLVGFV